MIGFDSSVTGRAGSLVLSRTVITPCTVGMVCVLIVSAAAALAPVTGCIIVGPATIRSVTSCYGFSTGGTGLCMLSTAGVYPGAVGMSAALYIPAIGAIPVVRRPCICIIIVAIDTGNGSPSSVAFACQGMGSIIVIIEFRIRMCLICCAFITFGATWRNSNVLIEISGIVEAI